MLAAAPAAEGGTAAQIAKTFGLHGGLFVTQIILILIAAGLLKKFAYGPVLGLLEERRKRIEEGLKNADKIKEELARAEETSKDLIQKANAQANKMIEEARNHAAKVQETEMQKAIAAAEQIITKATQATEMERARMMGELKREIAQLVVKTTTAVVGKVLSAEDQKRLVEETQKQLAA